MPNRFSADPALAAAVFALAPSADGYPAGCNAQIFPDGAFRAEDGRPRNMDGVEVDDWQMNAEIAAALIADLESSGKPILYDYEHRSMYGDTRAAGWIVELVYVSGRGLFARVEWTPRGAKEIADKEFRYSSPLFYFDRKTGAVTSLESTALTNNPALGDLGAVDLARRAALAGPPVGALAKKFLTAGGPPGTTTGDPEMNPEQLAALTAERDGLKTSLAALTAQVAALTAERDGLKAKVDAAEQERANAALAAEQKTKDDLITAACSGDKPLMTPAQAEAVKSLSVAELTKFIDTLKPVPLTQRQTDGKGGGDHGLSAEQLTWCSRMGVTPEQFVEAQKSQN